MAGEFTFIDWVRARTPSAPGVLVGPGDDCAVLAPGERSQVITTDMLMDGTDFVLADVGPRRVGRKALAVNLSDIAAMAAVPRGIVVSVAFPVGPTAPACDPQELYLGLRDVADAFDVPIVGGDTNSWHGPLVISVTAFGEVTDRGAVLRSGAKVGDRLFVTGPLGGSILGHHLDFTPRVREALRLHETVDLHALIDVSDGLTADLNHILQASGCGAELWAEVIPIRPAAEELANRTGKTALDHALGDGEDFELVFAVAEADVELLALSGVPVWPIGRVVESGLWLLRGGTRTAVQPQGWVHRLEPTGT